ncbi:hypothetical protein K431DRAFT_194608, partial [Polychaeton citri CBS 116435]
PQPRDILPPLLACLPTAFLAPRPPPALLPLLSPLLRQRVNFLADSAQPQRNGQGGDGWLPLLSWSPERASRLPPVIERLELEPHPVSGELELDDVRAIKYRRLDEETLQSKIEVEQFGLLPIYVWCDSDEHAGEEGSGPGWKLVELRSLEDDEDETEWFDSASEANDACAAASSGRAFIEPSQTQQGKQEQKQDDDDDYWAAYDRTPGRTPAVTPGPKRSPAPFRSSSNYIAPPGASLEEEDYYARYGEEVQPALDSHDPDEDHPELTGSSSLNGDSLVSASRRPPPSAYQQKSLFPADSPLDASMRSLRKEHESLEAPRPISPTSSHSSVDKLEERARQMSDGEEVSSMAQNAIKQHISTDVKSLYRLAKGVGMTRREFQRVVKRELEVLALMD